MNSGVVTYAYYKDLLILKLAGSIRIASRDACRLSAALEAFIRRVIELGSTSHILIDLTQTTAIDSTNLGLLAQIAQFTRARWQRRPTILSTNEDIDLLLEGVGFNEVFNIVHHAVLPETPLTVLPGVDASEIDQVQMMLEAHRTLVSLNRANQVQFQNVVEVLEEERRKCLGPDRSA